LRLFSVPFLPAQIYFIPTGQFVGSLEASKTSQYFELTGIQISGNTFISYDTHSINWKNLGGVLKPRNVPPKPVVIDETVALNLFS
jgi:hypothetical protein